MNENNVALLLDFENLAISAEQAYPSKEKPLKIGPIVDFANSKGNICVKKAYADFSNNSFSRYQFDLSEHGFELVHLPATSSQGKNGSDVRMAIDAMENMELFKAINVFIIGSGDTDFIPLIQRIRARGKSIITIGFELSVGKLIKKNSMEFKSLEELIGTPEEESLSSEFVDDIPSTYVEDLVIRLIKNRNDSSPIKMSNFKMELLKLDPSFSEKKLGFASFKKFVEALEGSLVEKIVIDQKTNLPIVYFPDFDISPKVNKNIDEKPQDFLKKKLRYVESELKRKGFCRIIFTKFEEEETQSISELNEILHTNFKNIPKVTTRKFIHILFSGHAFEFKEKNAEGPLLLRKLTLRNTISNADILEKFYMMRIYEIMISKYPDLDKDTINKLLKTIY